MSCCLRLGAASWLLLLYGCPGPPCPTTPHADPGQALSFHRSMRRHATSLRAEARVEQWGREGRIRGTVLMFIQRPDRVRFDAMTQFGPAAILTSDGESFALTDLRESRYLFGRSCPQNIERLLGIRMSGREVTLFLLGDTPLLEAEDRSIVCEDGAYLVELRAASGERQQIELAVREADVEAPIELQRLRVVRSELFDSEGDPIWRATFDDYRVIRDPHSEQGYGVAMPFRVRFEHPAERADTLVRFESIDLNIAPPGEAFVQSPRPGIEVEEVECE